MSQPPLYGTWLELKLYSRIQYASGFNSSSTPRMRSALGAGSGTEIIPGKHSDSDTRIKPLPLTSGHGRYITVTPERVLVSVGEWPLRIITIINL